jgi:nitrile hydratase
MFAPGDIVRVKDNWPEADGPVHIRTPHYVRGITGQVVRRLGDFANPEDLAFARPSEPRPLYHVRFRKAALWPEPSADDAVLVEIFEHWLEPS